MYTILCVDKDHTPTVQSLCLILQFAGYKCLIAETAENATRIFSDNNVDLVIVDHGLGDVTGIELASHLKSIKFTRVLMLTGNTALETTPRHTLPYAGPETLSAQGLAGDSRVHALRPLQSRW